MVTASYAPLLALVLAKLAGASDLTAANVGLTAAVAKHAHVLADAAVEAAESYASAEAGAASGSGSAAAWCATRSAAWGSAPDEGEHRHGRDQAEAGGNEVGEVKTVGERPVHHRGERRRAGEHRLRLAAAQRRGQAGGDPCGSPCPRPERKTSPSTAMPIA